MRPDRPLLANELEPGSGEPCQGSEHVVGDLSFPTELVASVTAPTLVTDGEHSPPIMHRAAEALVQTLPDGRRCTLPWQSHDISPDATAPVLAEFLTS